MFSGIFVRISYIDKRNLSYLIHIRLFQCEQTVNRVICEDHERANATSCWDSARPNVSGSAGSRRRTSVLYNGSQMTGVRMLLGTTNPAKQRSLRCLLAGLGLGTVTPRELGLGGRGPDEAGLSHVETARSKAEGWSRAAGMMAISSDGGLVVPILGDRWDSLYTRRFAGDDVDDGGRRDRLLQMMRPFAGEDRRASWIEALAIAREGITLVSWEVEGATGFVAEKPGKGPSLSGFWVFSLWYFPHLGKTYNELHQEELEALNDHWVQLKSLVRDFFGGGTTES